MQLKTLQEIDGSEGLFTLLGNDPQQIHLANTDIVLIPQPSGDPEDPLSWARWKKHAAFASACAFTFCNNFSGTVLSDSFDTLALSFGVSFDTVSGLLTWVVLTLGLSNFFWVPLAVYFGKRPIFLISCGICTAAAVWAAVSKDFANLQAACIVGAFGGSASEAVSAAVINDLYFLHERGTMMSIYILSITWGSSFGPLVGGYLIENLNWKWTKGLSAIILGLTFCAIWFFMAETRLDRINCCHGIHSTHNLNNRTQGGPQTSRSSQSPRLNLDGSIVSNTAVEQPDGSRSRTCSASLSALSYTSTMRGTSFVTLVWRPLPLLAYPACAFATLIYSIALAPTIMANVTSSSILIPAPHNFSVSSVGLINVAGLVGQAIGAVAVGSLADNFCQYICRKRGGVFQPEMRLFTIIFPTVSVVAGLLLFGFAAQNGLHWSAIFVAYGLISVGLSGAAGAAMVYVLDSHPGVAAEALETINGIKNIVAFGFVKGALVWVQSWGYAAAFGTLAGIFILIAAGAIPLWIWGVRIRRHTTSKWRLIR